MWNETDRAGQGGGFLSSPAGQFNSPSGSGSADKRPDRIQSVVPVLVSTVLATAADQPLRVAGQEVHMAVLAGQLEAIDRAATKINYTLADDSGSLSAVRWLDAEQVSDVDGELAEGMLCRMVARVRPSKGGGPPSVLCLHLAAISPEERAVHGLEVQHAELKIEHAAALAAGGPPVAAGLPSSTMGGGEMPMVVGGGIVGLTPQQQMVYGAISACPSDQGVHRDQVYASVAGKLPKTEVDRMIEFLSNEGHIYNTTDDDHYKATDC